MLRSLTVFYEYISPQIFKKWAKPYLKIFFEKVFKFFGLKLRIFWTLIVLKISWLATRFIFELIGVGKWGMLRILMNHKHLKMFLCKSWSTKHSLFVVYFTKNCTAVKVLTFDMNGQSGSNTLLPLPASASTKICCFYRFDFHIPGSNTVSRDWRCCVIDVFKRSSNSSSSLIAMDNFSNMAIFPCITKQIWLSN